MDTPRPHPARIYDWFPGGRNDHPVDDAAGRRMPAVEPGVPLTARTDRASTHRSARRPAEQGVRRFPDAGAGIPAGSDPHRTVQGVAPGPPRRPGLPRHPRTPAPPPDSRAVPGLPRRPPRRRPLRARPRRGTAPRRPPGGAVDHVQADARDRRRGPDPALGEPVPGRQGVVGPGRVAVARTA
ncbi:SAM-dependent methyltransferase [Streptomyces chilikensis]|uniref:SAM-dependent methyltransferase n=1 Tax=Streptomyces chilikensis TaxID=1194079 RepID=UPI001F0E0A25|nr:SAM-dependent methyltransferase [Streptomyces chilikensis]